MGKPNVPENLVKIVKQYDITLVQEIRDSQETAIFQFLDMLNADAGSKEFAVTVGSRLGTSTSKEQYAYIYRPSRVTLLKAFDYPDPETAELPDGVFDREPYVAHFSCPDCAVQEFFLAGIHTAPSRAETEIDQMVDVYDYAIKELGTDNGILMGDFNAGCSYFTKTEMSVNRLKLDTRFRWLIGDDADTTTKASICAYDRFVVGGTNLQAHSKNAKVYNFITELGISQDLGEDISDHFNIEMDIV